MGGASSPRVAPWLLTVGEVAERLRVSTATVYALCKRGALRHVRVANAIRVPEAALLAFIGFVAGRGECRRVKKPTARRRPGQR